MITHSMIIACLKSYEMAHRHIRWLAQVLPDNWELIFVDDGSEPPIEIPVARPKNFTLLRTYEKRALGEWTQKLAINRGVALARGEWLVKTDIDHVFTRRAVEIADAFRGDAQVFRRRLGYLSEALTLADVPGESLYSTVDDIWVCRISLFRELGGYAPHALRRYGGGGNILHPWTQDFSKVPSDALIYVVPDYLMRFHDLPRIP